MALAALLVAAQAVPRKAPPAPHTHASKDVKYSYLRNHFAAPKGTIASATHERCGHSSCLADAPYECVEGELEGACLDGNQYPHEQCSKYCLHTFETIKLKWGAAAGQRGRPTSVTPAAWLLGLPCHRRRSAPVPLGALRCLYSNLCVRLSRYCRARRSY